MLKEQYVMGEEKWQIMRAIPHLLWLIDVGDNQVSADTAGHLLQAEPLMTCGCVPLLWMG